MTNTMTKIKFEAYCCIPKSTQIRIYMRSFEYALFNENVHPCDFKPIYHVLSVHSNVTAVTTMCFIGGIAFMTVVDWGNALFVPLGHLLDHPIFIIIVTITPSSSSSSKVIFHIIPSFLGVRRPPGLIC